MLVLVVNRLVDHRIFDDLVHLAVLWSSVYDNPRRIGVPVGSFSCSDILSANFIYFNRK
jgi:hypothetical protein